MADANADGSADVLGRVPDLVVDVTSRGVYLDGRRTERFSKRDFDVLALLYKRRGEVVEHDAIKAAGWPERNGDVGGDEIAQTISKIRRALGPGLIETFPKQGYRLTPASQLTEESQQPHVDRQLVQ
jgi:DNA-binding winged helix-turn-helix (wHTH) protein